MSMTGPFYLISYSSGAWHVDFGRAYQTVEDAEMAAPQMASQCHVVKLVSRSRLESSLVWVRQ